MKRCLFLCFLFLCCMGCRSTREQSYLTRDYTAFHGQKISALTLKDGSVVRFAQASGRYYEEIKNDSTVVKKIIGYDVASNPLAVELSSVLEVQCQTEEINVGGTIITILLVSGTALILLFLAALGGSNVEY